MAALPHLDLALAPADSARVVTQVYAVSLLAAAPLLVAATAGMALRGASAAGRLLVWRAALLALLVVIVGRQLPVHQVAWVVPSTLALPLVELGRARLAGAARSTDLLDLLAIVYVAGVLAVLLPLLRARARVRALGAAARPLHDAAWTRLLDDARTALGVRRAVKLVVSHELTTPVTWGLLRPVIALPDAAERWCEAHRRAALLHEMTHVRRLDVAWLALSRLVCALYWFHPGAWWVARGLRAECERACDERVLALGVRRSDYASLLVLASDARAAMPAPALAARGGLRDRLRLVLDVSQAPRAAASRFASLLAAAVLAVAAPASTLELAPTRDVLTGLMRDARWETRAYAIAGLAQRRDSVELARAAALRDPSPHVREYAQRALARGAADSTVFFLTR